jgi:hypothetical protein
MRFQMLVYPGMTLLDLVGPAQTWAALPGVEMQFVWKERGLAGIAAHLPAGFDRPRDHLGTSHGKTGGGNRTGPCPNQR